MDAVVECFMNRREVSPQEPSVDFLLLQELADDARCGGAAEKATARIVILDALRGMWRDGMSHRERVEVQRVAGLLRSLGADEEAGLSLQKTLDVRGEPRYN